MTSHVKIGLLALGLAILLGLPIAWLTSETVLPQTVIAVEHDVPLTIRIATLTGTGAGIVELSHNGSTAIAVHLPSSWTREEVRGVPLARVTFEAQDWNYVRWVLPPSAHVRFTAAHLGRITLHNPSGIPLTVSTTVIDAGTNRREEDAHIVTTDPYTLP